MVCDVDVIGVVGVGGCCVMLCCCCLSLFVGWSWLLQFAVVWVVCGCVLLRPGCVLLCVVCCVMVVVVVG